MSINEMKECQEKIASETAKIMESPLRESYPDKWDHLVRGQVMLQNELIIAALVDIADTLLNKD